MPKCWNGSGSKCDFSIYTEIKLLQKTVAFICSIIMCFHTYVSHQVTSSLVAYRDVQGERKNETQKESISGSFKKDKTKVYTDIQERRDWWTNLSLFPCGVGKIDHCKTCALCTVIILPESQDRSSQSGLLAIVLHSLHFHYSSLWMHTQMHRWPFLAACFEEWDCWWHI